MNQFKPLTIKSKKQNVCLNKNKQSKVFLSKFVLYFDYCYKKMAVKVLIPTPLQKYTNNLATVECQASNIKELLDSLEENFKGIKERLCDENGNPRRFLNIYVNSEDIRFLEGVETVLEDNFEVSIVPAVAGG